MSFVFPNASTTEMPSREGHPPFASTSAAPSSSAGPSGGVGPAADSRRAGGSKARKRAGKGKGRMMMIKVFYSLQSPRFGTSSTPAAAPSSAPSPDFLAVLDPSLAPSPAPSPQPDSQPQTNYSCIARLSAPVWVQVLGAKKPAGADLSEEKAQFGRVTLKTCLSAICISRPELVIDATKDFSVFAVDPYESSHQHQPPAMSSSGASSSSRPGEGGHGLVEGKGMLSWTLAEKKEGTTMVCGRINGPEGGEMRRSKRRKFDDGNIMGENVDEEDSEDGDEGEETLEVWLQLSERDAFTQGQFLDCLRSYHNPVPQLQSELSDFNSSPPKRRESMPFPPSSSSAYQPRSSGPTLGDPVKRKRPREQPSLPLSAGTPPLPLPPASALAGTSQSSSSASPALPADPAGAVALKDPRVLALLAQLLPTLAGGGAAPAAAPLSLDSPQGQTLLPAIRTLAKFYYGIDLPGGDAPAPSSSSFPSSSITASTSARPPTAATSTSTMTTLPQRKKTAKEREHFAAIDTSTVKSQGKQNPRDPSGCSNCKRKKSTVWREGAGPDGRTTSVCNGLSFLHSLLSSFAVETDRSCDPTACGIFYNKNGYHRSKGVVDPAARTSPAQQATSIFPSSSSIAGPSTSKPGRPLTARLTAACEADLNKRKAKKKSSSSGNSSTARPAYQPGIIPPPSPSKQIGPRSPSLAFAFPNVSRSGGVRPHGIMSSPGRSPRMRYRQVHAGLAATSPVRGSSSRNIGLGFESDGDERGADGSFDFASLFGGPGSPSPVRRTLAPALDVGNGNVSAGKTMPSYLLTASPGTALDRILNDTNIGGFSALGEPMQLEQGPEGGAEGGAGSFPGDFSFFLQPGSPTLEKENERPRMSEGEIGATSTATDAPTTDFDSFESVLSSLRRNFSTRLSSNALTAPSSPIPSSPCVQPRTSAGTPGSKGKAPLSCGRPAPSVLDSFIDGLVPALALDPGMGTTPASDSDAWSPGQNDDGDKTITLDSHTMAGANGSSRPPHAHHAATSSFDLSHLVLPNKLNNASSSRRAAFLPSHLVAPSDATEFDFGSLPPSSPPQLPSEAFPTPSDFDGITPSAEGGDLEERDRLFAAEDTAGAEGLTIEAVAEKVATEPNEEARSAMMELLQSLGRSENAEGGDAASAAAAGQVQLDRSTVNKLLALISANPNSASAAASSTSTPALPPPASTSTATAPVETKSDDSTDLSQFDFFKSLEPTSHDQAAEAKSSNPHQQQHASQSGPMNELYGDLFSDSPF
ncbi:hypothetical protein JCM5296_004838 [Sporobolomyces johnsonii]